MRTWTGDYGSTSDSCLVMLPFTPLEAYYQNPQMSETDTNNNNNQNINLNTPASSASRSGYNLSPTTSQAGDNVIITLPEIGQHQPIRSELVLTAKQEKNMSAPALSVRETHHKQSPKYSHTPAQAAASLGELQGIKKTHKTQKYGQKIELSKNKNPPIKIKLERMVRTNKLLWTAELHRIFLNAVRKLGMESTPNAIREEMNVEGLTRDNVASHLQKYRTRVRAAKTEEEKAALLKQEEEFLSQSDESQSFSSPPPPTMPSSSSASALPAYATTTTSASLPQQQQQQPLPAADTALNLLNNIASNTNQLFPGVSTPQFPNYLPSMLPQTSYLPQAQQPAFRSQLYSLGSFNPNYFYSQQVQPTSTQQQQQQQQSQSQPQQPQQATPQPGQQMYYLRQAEELKEDFNNYYNQN